MTLRTCWQSLALGKRCLLVVLLLTGAGAVLAGDYESGQLPYGAVLLFGAGYSLLTLPLVWFLVRRARLIGTFFLAFWVALGLILVVPGDAHARFVADAHRLREGMKESEVQRIMHRYVYQKQPGTTPPAVEYCYFGCGRWLPVQGTDELLLLNFDDGKVSSVHYQSGKETNRCGCD